jgi:hypothetical protein
MEPKNRVGVGCILTEINHFLEGSFLKGSLVAMVTDDSGSGVTHSRIDWLWTEGEKNNGVMNGIKSHVPKLR